MVAFAVAALGGHAALGLLVWLLVGILVIGIVYLIAAQFLPPPIPLVLALVLVLILLIWLLGG